MGGGLLSVVGVFVAGAVGHTVVRPADGWKGQQVMGTKPAEQITFGDVVDGKQVYFQFRGIYPQIVREDREGWLRLFDGFKEGWAKKGEFVLLSDAPAYYTGRINSNPADDFAWNMRGIAWGERGEYDNAIKDYTEVIRLNPTNAHAYSNRASAWSSLLKYDNAVRDASEAIRLNPALWLPYQCRGVSYIKMKNMIWRSKT